MLLQVYYLHQMRKARNWMQTTIYCNLIKKIAGQGSETQGQPSLLYWARPGTEDTLFTLGGKQCLACRRENISYTTYK
ncbi:hypothetical protein E2C01_065624 [Portunus trituberculatus]|uniref:Uncharacterized protein n=1 Tax=Portunus trituberculatus TaxID=210409 RepID=A0A5B7HQ38_PORTR|nr:hypothetical protein [Portunus trituberculatus]